MMTDEKYETVLDIGDIHSILPQRYPFLMVDRLIHLDLEEDYAIGQKNLTMNEEFFQGHFPGKPIMPGVLMLEALAQTGGVLANRKGYTEQIAVFLKIDKVKFRKPVYPGDVLYLHVKGTYFGSRGARIKAWGTVNEIEGRPCIEAEISCALVNKGQI